MKKFLSLVLCCLILVFSFGCNGGGESVKLIEYDAYVDGFYNKELKYDKKDVVEILSDEVTKEDAVDFYVLAPQDYRLENGAGNEVFIDKWTIEEEGALKYGSVIYEWFSVCNEQKYGTQITDWGQIGGIAINFQIVIAIDMTYDKIIEELIIDYVDIRDCVDFNQSSFAGHGTLLRVNIYDGQTCFASATMTGIGYENIATAKLSLERYITENLMLKSEFLARAKEGEFKASTCLVVDKSEIDGGYYSLGGCIVKDIFDGGRHGDAYERLEEMRAFVGEHVNVYLYPGKNALHQGEDGVYICATDIDEEGNFIETHLVESLTLFDSSLGGTPSDIAHWNVLIKAMITSIPTSLSSIDTAKVTYKWIDERAVNVYYDEYCFATVAYVFNDYWVDDKEIDNAFLKNYVEEYVKENLKLIA